MSWTNSDTIKRHLEAFTVDALEVQFHPVRLVAGESHQLPHAPLASGSVLVQAMLSAAPGGPSSQSSRPMWRRKKSRFPWR